MPTIHRNVLAALAFVALVWAGSAAARADDTVNLSIGQKGIWETMVAQQGLDAGIFQKEHLTLNLAYTAGGPDTISAVATGTADFGISVGTTAVIAAYSKGAPIRIVAASMTGEPDLFFYVKADSPIQSMADMNGKSMGFTRPGSSSFTVERLLAEQAHVQPNFVATGEASSTLTQVMSGQVDVGWSAPPFAGDLIEQKKIRVIATGADAKALQGQTVRVEIGNANFLKAHHDVAVRFWRAYAATIDWMYKNQAASLANFARYNNLSPDDVKGVLKFFPVANMMLYPVSGIGKSIQDAVDFKFIPKPLDAEQTQGIFDLLAPHR